ncbi:MULTISPECIES: YybH family protein [unclassified Microbacterium]|uniref:YybH family protein n=1 Tax=unclassified Microbacterium TaxID=2609290 RepID=UPI00365FABDF
MDPTARSLPLEDVHRLLTGMYDDYLRGDSTAIDDRLAEDVTIFDSAADALVTGLEELAALRRARTSAPAAPPPWAWTENSLTVEDLRVREVGDILIATWWLRVDGTDSHGAAISPELSRNTAVLQRRQDGALRIAHLHEDVRQEARPVV